MYHDHMTENYNNRLSERELFWRSEIDKTHQLDELSKEIAINKVEQKANDKLNALEEKLRSTSAKLLTATTSISVRLGRDTLFASDFKINRDDAAQLMGSRMMLSANGTLFPELKTPYWTMQTGVGLAQISSFLADQTIKLGPGDDAQYKDDPTSWVISFIID